MSSTSTIEANSGQPAAEPAAVQRRVWRNLIAVAVGGLILALALAPLRVALGFGLGGALAVFNYWWLSSSLRGVLAMDMSKTPPGTMLKLFLRWIIVAAVAYAANSTGYFDAIGIVTGLTAPAAAIIVEAAYIGFRASNLTN